MSEIVFATMVGIVAIFYIAVLNVAFSATEALRCVPGSSICFLSELDYEREHIPLVKSDSKLISVCLQRINDRLIERVSTSDFDKNLKEIKSMLKREVRAKHLRLTFGKKPTNLDDAQQKDILINVLLRFRDLRQVQEGNMEVVCSNDVTEILNEVNELALNPIDRLLNFRRGKPSGHVLLSRLDYFIVEAARRRAHKCDTEFQSKHLAGAEELSIVVDDFKAALENLKGNRQ